MRERLRDVNPFRVLHPEGQVVDRLRRRVGDLALEPLNSLNGRIWIGPDLDFDHSQVSRYFVFFFGSFFTLVGRPARALKRLSLRIYRRRRLHVAATHTSGVPT
jgi:hypothetical protein